MSIFFSRKGRISAGIDFFRSNIFSTNEFEPKFPTVAYLGNFMDGYKAKKAKIGQNALFDKN